jgi:hypothetical protein
MHLGTYIYIYFAVGKIPLNVQNDFIPLFVHVDVYICELFTG